MIDLETTGFSRSTSSVIEIAGQILGPDGIAIEDGTFVSLIKPPTPIPQIITDLTGISNEMVSSSSLFKVVMEGFFCFLSKKVQSYTEEQNESTM